MKKQALLLTVMGIACITVWTSFFLFIFEKDEEESSQRKEDSLLTEKEMQHAKVEQLEEAEITTNGNRIDYSVRGIHEGDFDHIANDKIISVEELLIRINN